MLSRVADREETNVAKKVQIFDELMEGFRDAIARKKGRHVALRVTRLPRLKRNRPNQTKKIGSTSSS